MKKVYFKMILFYIIIGGICLATTTIDNTNSNSPFLGEKIIQIKDLNYSYDDRYITLKGYIVEKLSDETFLFKDETGKIYIEIDRDEQYLLRNVDSNTFVEITGEYDHNTFKPNKIDIKNLKIINNK